MDRFRPKKKKKGHELLFVDARKMNRHVHIKLRLPLLLTAEEQWEKNIFFFFYVWGWMYRPTSITAAATAVLFFFLLFCKRESQKCPQEDGRPKIQEMGLVSKAAKKKVSGFSFSLSLVGCVHPSCSYAEGGREGSGRPIGKLKIDTQRETVL